MMNKIFKGFKNGFTTGILLLCLLSGLSSCKDIIEIDLSKKTMTGLAPAANTVSSSFTQTFRWDELEGASEYKFQIAKPTFTSPLMYVTDCTIVNNNITVTLSPGTYEWRVRAENGSSKTEYITNTITIDSTLDLSGQSVILLSPSDNHYSKNLGITFSWQSLANTDNYLFQLFSNGTVIETQALTSTSYLYNFSAQGTYTWKVFAQNNLTTSQPATRTVIVDTTAPAPLTPFYPAADTITANPVPLKWNVASASSSFDATDYCQLQISTDSTFVLITTKDTVIDAAVNPMIYNFYGATVGQKYFWRVRAQDKAGNYSDYSAARRIKRN